MSALEWEGCLNVRDLGGHPTGDGAVTRHRVVVRADALRQLSDAGWAQLVDYGVARIVDLRFNDEREADPPRELPVEVVHLPLLGHAWDPDYWDYLNEHLDNAERIPPCEWLETQNTDSDLTYDAYRGSLTPPDVKNLGYLFEAKAIASILLKRGSSFLMICCSTNLMIPHLPPLVTAGRWPRSCVWPVVARRAWR